MVLAAEDVSFVRKEEARIESMETEPETEEGDTSRVKELGEFEVEIRLKGSEAPVRRKVIVSPVES